jgi:hypothetical protein
MMRSKALRAFNRSLLLILIVVALKRDSLHPADFFTYRTDPFAGPHRFDWWAYEFQTLFQKLAGTVTPVDQPRGLDRGQQVQQVRDYFSLVGEIGRLESDIMTTRAREGAAADISTLQTELDVKREKRLRLENLVENIIRQQVEVVLLAHGITLHIPFLHNWVMPPVEFEFQSSPDFLIISRRDNINRIGEVSLQPTLSLEQIEEIESLTDELDVSSLVVPTGGVGSYPTVIVEDATLRWSLSVVIHEWTHNYLYLHPLGQRFGASQELTSMNETVASMVEDELSLELGRIFYPDIYEARLEEMARETSPVAERVHEDEFSFNANMRKTRLHVEQLLMAGKVEEAEVFMEERRQKLVEMGYYIRKLNQAYFAFYGSYAAGKGWAAATNPIGEQLRILRERSPSLADFLATVARMSSYQDLLDELARQ